jgi:hypothetical protein
MKSVSAAKSDSGLTLRQAALVAGFAYLLNPVSYAEFSVYPKLVAANNSDQTVAVAPIARTQTHAQAVESCPKHPFVDRCAVSLAARTQGRHLSRLPPRC